MSSLGFGVQENKLTQRAHYSLCRHPIMLGFFVMFFAVPTMTVTHLVFSVACTVYILVAVSLLEEPDLEEELGREYADYKARVPNMYCHFDWEAVVTESRRSFRLYSMQMHYMPCNNYFSCVYVYWIYIGSKNYFLPENMPEDHTRKRARKLLHLKYKIYLILT